MLWVTSDCKADDNLAKTTDASAQSKPFSQNAVDTVDYLNMMYAFFYAL